MRKGLITVAIGGTEVSEGWEISRTRSWYSGRGLKTGDVTSVDMLHWLLGKVWEEEQVQRDYRKVDYLVKLSKKGDLHDCCMIVRTTEE